MNRVLFKIYSCTWKNMAFSTCSAVCKQSNVSRQGKIFSKLFGKRVSGSKKRWVENPLPSAQFQLSSPFQFTSKKNDPSSKRRTTVLNKLFMSHITDLLATGEASAKILGKGLQITRVKVTPNFQVCNVYWMAMGGVTEDELEQELQKCGGLLRHELSQLRLMGEVPRVHFVKDKTYANLALVETILKDCDFGDSHLETDSMHQNKNDLYQQSFPANNEENTEDDEEPLPPMRHDVFGLDRREIMLRILSKMKKSEEAWARHRSAESSPLILENEELSKCIEDEELSKCIENEELSKSNENVERDDEAFKRYLSSMAAAAKMRNRRFHRTDDGFYRKIGDDEDDPLEDGDFVEDDFDENK